MHPSTVHTTGDKSPTSITFPDSINGRLCGEPRSTRRTLKTDKKNVLFYSVVVSKEANHACPSESTMPFPGCKCPFLGRHHYCRGCWRYQLGQTQPAALSHRVWTNGADRAGAVPVMAQCPHVHVDSRGIWACGTLEGKQQRTFFQNSLAQLSFSSVAMRWLLPGCL